MIVLKKSVQQEDLLLTYEVYGEGNNVILCFHGNDRSAKDFKFLASSERKIISIWLFFHGDSMFSNQRLHQQLLSTLEVKSLIEMILINEKVSQFHLLAYSQGGRFALCLFPHFANKINSFTLIAPDGLNDHNFYSWSQRQAWARRLYIRWIKKPEKLRKIVKWLVKCKIIAPKMIEFMNHYTEDKAIMIKAYKTWAGFRKLRPNSSLIKIELKDNQTPFRLIIGRYDQIITVKSARHFLKKINKEKTLIIIPFGHDVFKPHILPILKENLPY